MIKQPQTVQTLNFLLHNIGSVRLKVNKHMFYKRIPHLVLISLKPNLVPDSCVHPSLHPNCHHKSVYVKFDLKLYFPPL